MNKHGSWWCIEVLLSTTISLWKKINIIYNMFTSWVCSWQSGVQLICHMDVNSHGMNFPRHASKFIFIWMHAMHSSWSHYWKESTLFMLQKLLGVFDTQYLCNQTLRNAAIFFYYFKKRLQPDVFVCRMKPMTVYSIMSFPWMMNEIINAQTGRSRLSDGRINAAYCSWGK